MKHAIALPRTGIGNPRKGPVGRSAWLALLLFAGPALAAGEPVYRVQESAPPVEVREYGAHAVAETRISGSFADAGNLGFRRLFGYISGENAGAAQVAMTAPVIQQADPRTDAAGVPGARPQEGAAYRIAFVLPEGYSGANAPVPTNPEVHIVDVPARRLLAVRYTGRWTEANYQEALGTLLAFAAARGYKLVGEPLYARYDPPIMPSFLRRNEVLAEIAVPDAGVRADDPVR